MRSAVRGSSTEQRHNGENRKCENGDYEKDCIIVVNDGVGLMKVPPLLVEKSAPLPIEEIEEISKQGCGQYRYTTCKVKNRRDYGPA